MNNISIKPIERLPSAKDLRLLAQKYIAHLEEQSRYDKEGEALEWLFRKYPGNSDIREVLVKVMALDSSYSTSLRMSSSILPMAMKIVSISNFDVRIRNTDSSLVDELCELNDMYGVIGVEDKPRRQFSFSTKYCCLHNLYTTNSPKGKNNRQYAIYDDFVAHVITYYEKEDKFLENFYKNNRITNLKKFWCENSYEEGDNTKNKKKITPHALKASYKYLYLPVIFCFRKYYHLTHLSFRELDHFLWQMGKEFFVDYTLEKAKGLFVIITKSKKMSIYKRYFINPSQALDECAKSVRYKRYKTETDKNFALRLLKDFFDSIARKEGIVGKYYIDLSDGQNLYIYQHIYEPSSINSKSQLSEIFENLRQVYGEILKTAKDKLKGFKESSSSNDFANRKWNNPNEIEKVKEDELEKAKGKIKEIEKEIENIVKNIVSYANEHPERIIN